MIPQNDFERIENMAVLENAFNILRRNVCVQLVNEVRDAYDFEVGL